MINVVALGELVSIKRGTTYKSALLGRPGPYLLGLASIARNGGFRSGSLKTYGGESPESLLVKPGELFASLKDVTQAADLLGSVARLPRDERPGRLTQDTVRLDIVSHRVDRDYLYWLLRAPEYRRYCRAHATGTTNLGLPREDFLGFPVRLPDLDEQRQIAEVLGALDDLIDTNERLKAALDELARTTFLRAWNGETWTTIGDLGDVIMGQSPPGYTYSENPVGMPFHQGVRDFGARFPRSRIYCSAPTRVAEAGDILIAVRAPVGEMNVAPERLAIGRGLAALRAARPSTALQAIRAFESTWSAHRGTGTVFSSINGRDLRSAKVPYVGDDGTEGALAELDHAYAALEAEGAELRRTRDELLPLLMSGTVRVKTDRVPA